MSLTALDMTAALRSRMPPASQEICRWPPRSRRGNRKPLPDRAFHPHGELEQPLAQRGDLRIGTRRARRPAPQFLEQHVRGQREQDAKLVERLRHGRRDRRAGCLQEGVAAANGVGAKTVVDENRAGIDATVLEVVIEVPFSFGSTGRLKFQPGDKSRQPAQLIEECDARKVNRGGKDIALPWHQRSSPARMRGRSQVRMSPPGCSEVAVLRMIRQRFCWK